RLVITAGSWPPESHAPRLIARGCARHFSARGGRRVRRRQGSPMRVLCRVAALVFALAACSSFEGQPVCGGEEVELPRANCPEAVEEAIGAVVPGTSVLFEPSPRGASGEPLGRAAPAGGRALLPEPQGERPLPLSPESAPPVHTG